MKYISILLLFLISISKISAQTPLQLKFINDQKDTINKELKDRYALKQQILKLQTSINTSNKQLFLNLVSSNSNKNEFNELFYYSDSLELQKVLPWKRAVILLARTQYMIDKSGPIKLLSVFDIDYFYQGLTKRKPINYNSSSLFDEIRISENIGTFKSMTFTKENGIWKLNYLESIYPGFRESYISLVSNYLDDKIYEPNLNAVLINSNILKWLEDGYKVKLSNEIWKPIKKN